MGDGCFSTNGNWEVVGHATQTVPGVLDAVSLPAGDYTVTLEDERVVDSLSIGAGATLKLALPKDGNGDDGEVPLTIFGGLSTETGAGLAIESKAFDKAHYQESATLITCGATSTAALQTLADSFNTAAGKTLVTVESGNRLVYTAPPPSGTMMIFR